jgi:hypothetical protein
VPAFTFGRGAAVLTAVDLPAVGLLAAGLAAGTCFAAAFLGADFTALVFTAFGADLFATGFAGFLAEPPAVFFADFAADLRTGRAELWGFVPRLALLPGVFIFLGATHRLLAAAPSTGPQGPTSTSRDDS